LDKKCDNTYVLDDNFYNTYVLDKKLDNTYVLEKKCDNTYVLDKKCDNTYVLDKKCDNTYVLMFCDRKDEFIFNIWIKLIFKFLVVKILLYSVDQYAVHSSVVILIALS
jgi:hypothetical protein